MALPEESTTLDLRKEALDLAVIWANNAGRDRNQASAEDVVRTAGSFYDFLCLAWEEET